MRNSYARQTLGELNSLDNMEKVSVSHGPKPLICDKPETQRGNQRFLILILVEGCGQLWSGSHHQVLAMQDSPACAHLCQGLVKGSSTEGKGLCSIVHKRGQEQGAVMESLGRQVSVVGM